MALAQDVPVNPEQLGFLDLADFELHGPVRQVKTCFLAADYCETVQFNRYGIELNEVKNRTLVSSQNGVVVFESKTNHGKLIDTYQNGVLFSREEDGGDITSTRRVFEYNAEFLPIKETLYTSQDGMYLPEGINIYTYQDGHLVSVGAEDGSFTVYYNAKGAKTAEKSVTDGETFLTEYTHDYDAQGNWIKLYEAGELTATREISYQ
ncbi:hypothetical protein GCM10008938_28820 [Deinococcus roseus]|uniref:Uncharacterized protein n=2 Tax=Deinococcus roseus TaxID=392414 RepID=A0ABQ2D142_9DEIO|nr:hypothetical protein GCM10008938_28820 [Deinococcus roseus]